MVDPNWVHEKMMAMAGSKGASNLEAEPTSNVNGKLFRIQQMEVPTIEKRAYVLGLLFGDIPQTYGLKNGTE